MTYNKIFEILVQRLRSR